MLLPSVNEIRRIDFFFFFNPTPISVGGFKSSFVGFFFWILGEKAMFI